MTDRPILYDMNQDRTFDHERGFHDILYSISQAVQDLLGQGYTVVAGLSATQTSPASLTINLAAGRILQLAAADAVSQGAIPQDLTQILQQGTAVAQQVTLSTSGLSTGQSRWALVQAQFNQVDVVRANDPNAGLLYFYNAANPTLPFQGPNNNGQIEPTVRQGLCSIGVIYGSVATTGSEVPPQPSAGWVPLYLIDLAFGQTSVTTNQILVAGPSVGTGVPSNYTTAPFLAGMLNQHHLGTPGQAPQIDLQKEVRNRLQLANLPSAGMAMITNFQSFSSSSSFTVPSGVTKVRVVVIGGGGGGGGSSATTSSQVSAAPGGNSGAYAWGYYTVTPGQVIAVTVGAGGTGGIAGGGNGGAGGASSFGGFLSCPGGHGGNGAPAAAAPQVQAPSFASGTPTDSGGGMIFGGAETSGFPGIAGTISNAMGGAGAPGIAGGGGSASVNGAGNPGIGRGSAGGGASSWMSSAAQAGGAGAIGGVSVEW